MKLLTYIITVVILVNITYSQTISVNDYFPSKIGNKWIYNTKSYDPNEPPFFYYGTAVIEVVGDTILSNSNKYLIFRDGLYNSFLRIDSIDNKVYEFIYSDSSNNYEAVYLDFNLTLNDTIVYPDSIGISFILGDSTTFANTNYETFVYEYNSGSIGFDMNYLKGIGKFTQKVGSLSFNEYTLKGCIIADEIYGDTLLTNIEDEEILIDNYYLFDNYPNPFNPSTNIEYSIKSRSHVILKIINTLGEEIEYLVDEIKSPGKYNVKFNASRLSSGVYIYQLKCNDFIKSKKLMFIK